MKRTGPLPFVGVDGEGGNIPDEYGFTSHQYTMLRAGDRYVTSGWLEFLASLPPGHIYIAYSFDYDVTMICRDLPEELLRIMLSGQPIWWQGYELSYRPKKEFMIRTRGRRVVINDIFSFFQCKFVTALRRWGIGTPEQLDAVDDGKEGRKEHRELTPEIIEYNRLECELYVELMDKFRRICTALGYLPRRWQGPGQLAKSMLTHHGVPKTRDLPEPNLAGVWEAAQAAYYGGRFETSAVGSISSPVDSWDINSAYPAAITRLPCLQHCRWNSTRTIIPQGIYRIRYQGSEGASWYGFPHRTTEGRIIFPQRGAGWYWGSEIIAAQKLGMKVELKYGFAYDQECDHRLFDFVFKVYALRKAVGKSEAGIALKLALNSLYGVFAQSIGDPPYSNPIYAGLITATTRAQLLEAISSDPWSVYMLATDGVYCAANSLDLTPSDDLGGWDHKTYPSGMHIVMPGVYFTGDTDVVRSRGIPENVITRNRQRLIDAYQGSPTDHITVSLRQFNAMRISLARNRPELMGSWVDTERIISYDWKSKRRPNILRRVQGIDRTLPYQYAPETESVPYSKSIGGNLARDMDRLEFADAPEFADTLISME